MKQLAKPLSAYKDSVTSDISSNISSKRTLKRPLPAGRPHVATGLPKTSQPYSASGQGRAGAEERSAYPGRRQWFTFHAFPGNVRKLLSKGVFISKSTLPVKPRRARRASDLVRAAASETYDWWVRLYVSTRTIWSLAVLYVLVPILVFQVLYAVQHQRPDAALEWLGQPAAKVVVSCAEYMLQDCGTGVAFFDYICAALILNYPIFYIVEVTWKFRRTGTVRLAGITLLSNVSALILVAACIATVTHAVSRAVLLSLLFVYLGAWGLWYCVSVDIYEFYQTVIKKEGLLQFLPVSVQNLLLRKCIFDWLTDSSFANKVRQFLPFFFVLSDEEANRALKGIPVKTRHRLLRPGLLGELPPTLQKLLSPQQYYLHRQASESGAPTEVDHPESSLGGNESNVSTEGSQSTNSANGVLGGFTFDYASRKAATNENSGVDAGISGKQPFESMGKQPSSKRDGSLMSDILSARLSDIIRRIILSPNTTKVEQIATVASLLSLVQILSSKTSRGQIVKFLRTLSFGSSIFLASYAILLRYWQYRYHRNDRRKIKSSMRDGAMGSRRQAHDAGSHGSHANITMFDLLFDLIHHMTALKDKLRRARSEDSASIMSEDKQDEGSMERTSAVRKESRPRHEVALESLMGRPTTMVSVLVFGLLTVYARRRIGQTKRFQ